MIDYIGFNSVTEIPVTNALDAIEADPAQLDSPFYNLLGQPVAHPSAPGVYLHHGHKILIK